ncbi:hypothetical protein EZS27_041274, partial [termite gut metagenome]
ILECKASFSPSLSKGNYNAFEDIAPNRMFIVIPSTESWSMKQGIDVIALDEIKNRIDELL